MNNPGVALVARLDLVSPSDERNVRYTVRLREPTIQEWAVEPQLVVRPGRTAELCIRGQGFPPAPFSDLCPHVTSLVLHEERDTGWWEAQIWLRPN